MRKPNRNYWITKCIMKYMIINIIATGSAVSNYPVKFTLGQRPPLSINHDTAISEQDNEPLYRKSDTYTNKYNNNVHLNNYDVITNNVDVIDDDANRLHKYETNILNNDESSEYDDSETVSNKNQENRREERELENNNTNLTTIYLAGYDDEIFQIKQEIQNKGAARELLICFYLCNDLHYNDLGCFYTDIDTLQNVLWKYTHYFCVDNQSLRPTWCLDDIFTTYNFPNRKDSIDDNVQVKNIEKGLSDIEEVKKVQDNKSNNPTCFNDKPLEIRKYYPKIIYPNENDLNGSDINILKQKFKGQNIPGKNVNMRYLDPKYYSKKECLEPGTEKTVNTSEREHNQNDLPLFPATIANTMIINDIKNNIDDGNNLTHINIDHSAEPSIIFEPIKNQVFIPNTNKDENNDYKSENLKAETLEVIEDSTQKISYQMNSTSTSEDNIVQYGNNSILLNSTATNTKYTNNTDDGQNNGTCNDSNEILSDDNLMNFTGSEINKLGPPSVEIIVEDNPLYDKHTDIGTYTPKLDDVTLTALYNNDRNPSILYNKRQNVFIPSSLKEAEVILKQPEYSVDTKKLPNKDQTVNLLEHNPQIKQLNTLATNPLYRYNFINRQSNNSKPHIPLSHIKHSDSGVNIYPVLDPNNNIALLRLPSSYFKLNRKTDDSFTSVESERYPAKSGFGNKQHYSPEKLTPDLTLSKKLKSPIKSSKSSNTCLFNPMAKESENRVPCYQISDAKSHPIKKVTKTKKWRKCPKVTDYNSLPIVYYPKIDKGVLAQSNNDIKPLNDHYKCSIPQDTLANLKNNYYFDTQRTNVKDFIKWDYLEIPPNNNIVKNNPHTFSKNNNATENIDCPIFIDNSGKYDVAEPIISKDNMLKNNNKPVSQMQRNVWPVDPYLKEIKSHVTKPDYSTLPIFYTIDPTSPYSSDSPTILSWPSPCTINKALKPYSFSFERGLTPDFLKTKPELKNPANGFIPSSYPTKCFPNLNLGIISTDPISRQLQNQQCLKNPQSQKNVPLNPISDANSEKVNFSSELSYRFPLESTYDRPNKNKLKFPDYITSVISSLNFKSILKTSIILPNKNDLRFPFNILCPFGVPCSNSYSPTKSVPIASLYTKSEFDYMVIYDLSQYKFPYTNSFLVNSLDSKIYPYYYIKAIITYIPKDFKTRLKAPINNTRLASPIPSSLITGLNSRGIPDRLSPMPTSPNIEFISKVFPFPMSSLSISSNKVPITDSLPIPISSAPVISWPTLSNLERGPISFPSPVQSSPIYSNIDRRLNGYSIPYSYLQPSSNASSKLFHPPVSFFISSPCTVLRSKGSPLPPLPLPILTNKELGTDSVPIPISSLPTSSWPITSYIPPTNSEPKTISASITFLPDSSKPDLSSNGFLLPTSSLPISSNKETGTTVCPFPISSLPVSSWPISPASQRRLKTFLIPDHFLPISFTSNHRSKGFPASTSSLPITRNLNQNLKGLPPPSLPITSNEDFTLKRFPISSFLPVSSNKDSSSNGFLFPMPSLPITSNKNEGTKRPPLPYLPTLALDRKPETFPMTFKSLPCSNLDQNIKDLFPPISYSPISSISCCQPKTIPAFIQPLPVSSNLDIRLKGFPAPISSSTFSSQAVPKTITSPVSSSYQFPLSSLPILSNKEVCNKINSNPISSLSVSSPWPMLSTPEIKPKNYRKPLPISSNKYFNSKDFSNPVLSLPISSPLVAVPKNIQLPHSSLHIPSALEIGSNSFLASVPSLPIASDIVYQSRYITPSKLPLTVSPNLGIKPKKNSEHIQSLPCLPNSSNIDLNSKRIQSPVSYLPFSLNKDLSLKGFSPTSGIKCNVFSASVQDLPIASNLYLNSISSSSELKPKTPSKPYRTLPVSSTIKPCLKGPPIPVISSPVSPTLEVIPKSKASPFLPSSSLTTEVGPKNLLPPFMYLPVPSTNRIGSKKILPLVASLPISSAIKLQPKSNPRHMPLPISPNKNLSIKGIPPTKLSLVIPSTLNLKPKSLPSPNQSMPILSNNISWKVFPSSTSPLPTSSPLELKPKNFPEPIDSMPNSSNKHPSLKGHPCPVSPLSVLSNRNLDLKSYPKHITPYLTLPSLKRTEMGSMSPFILSNASTLQEPRRTEKDQLILDENMGLRYPHNATSSPNVLYLQPNSILLTPYLDINDKPKNISYFTNIRPVSTPKSQEVTLTDPTSYPIISNNTFYQPFNPYFISSKVINSSKPSFISQDKALSNPVPYSLISNNPPSEIIPNSYSNPYEQKTVQYYPNFKPMPQPQSAVLNNALPNSFIGNISSLYPFKAKPKINFPLNEPKEQNTYLYFPFQSNQKLEIIPLTNNTVQYLDSHSPKSTLNYYTINPQSASNLLQNSSTERKLKSINLPTRSNLNKLYNKPFSKSTITTPIVPIHTDTEEDKTYATCYSQNDDKSSTQHYLQPILDTTKYPTAIFTPTFASKFEPRDTESKLTTTLQSLLTAPSHYKEKLIKVSPYNFKPLIQSSNEEFNPDSLPCRKTQTKIDRKYPQYPTEMNNPTQSNLHRITNAEVPKYINKIEYIYPKTKPPSCVDEKLHNISNSINQSIKDSVVIPIGIAKYEPDKMNKLNINTNDPNIELKAWLSKLTVLKPKIVLDEVEIKTLNFVPIVKNIAYTPEVIQDTVKRFVERYYGKPIILKGIYSFCQPYHIDDVTHTVYIIWPAIYKCCINNC